MGTFFFCITTSDLVGRNSHYEYKYGNDVPLLDLMFDINEFRYVISSI